MNALLYFPFSRKTFDLFNLLNKSFPNLNLYFTEPSNFFLKFLLRLVYPNVFFIEKSELDLCASSFIVFPQEVSQLKEINSRKINFQCIIPNDRIIDICNQKDEFYLFCELNDIKHPKTFLNNQEIEVKSSIIFKPKIGQGSRGIKIIKNFVGTLSIPNGYIAQQYLGNSNEIIGFFAYCLNGKIINSYQHKRIKTYPSSGGVSVYSVINVDESLYLSASNLIQKLNYSGLIMIEYKKHLNDFYVIEINPRLWGSILLCLHQKNNLIYDYLKSLKYPFQDKNTNHKKSIVWLLPYGIFNLNIYKNIPYSYLINFSNSSLFRSLLFFITIIIYKVFNLSNENSSI